MSFFSIARLWLRRFNRPRKKMPFVRKRLLLESLEQRTVPSALVQSLKIMESGPNSDPNPAPFVTGLYYDLLNREPQQSEVDYWTSQMASGVSRAQVAHGFLASSEYLYDLIRSDYQTYLGRNPDPVGRDNWFSDLQSGLNAQQLLAGIISSQEYFTNHGGTVAGWLTGLYQDLLGRNPDAPGLQAWEQMLQRGVPGWTVANDFIHSSEAEQVQIAQAYQNILGRAPDPAGQAAWAAAMAQGLTLEQLDQGIASSQEYYNQQQGVDLPVLGGSTANVAPAVAVGSSTSGQSTPLPSGNTSTDPGTGSGTIPNSYTGTGAAQSPPNSGGSAGTSNPTPSAPAQGGTSGTGAPTSGTGSSTPSLPAEGGTTGTGTPDSGSGTPSGTASGGSLGGGTGLPGGSPTGGGGGIVLSGGGGSLPGGSSPGGGILPGGGQTSGGGTSGASSGGGLVGGGTGGSPGGTAPGSGSSSGGTTGGGTGATGTGPGPTSGGTGTGGSSSGGPILNGLTQNVLIVGPNIDVNRQPGDQTEESIAIDPTNPQRMFVVANDDSNATLNGMAAGYSTDGGKTWIPREVGNGSDGIPGAFSDPWVAWDSFGNLFFSYIQAVNLNANPPDINLVVVLSTDGGKSFRKVFEQDKIFDHPEIAVGAGEVFVTYANNTSGGNIEIDVSGAQVTGLGQVGAFKTFVVPGSTNENFGDVAIGPKGQVAVTFQSSLVSASTGPDTAFVSLNPKPFNGGVFGTPNVAAPLEVGNTRLIPAQPVRGISATLGLQYDRSGGAHNGRLYLVFTNAPNTTTNDTNIIVRFSDNDGKTWSTPVKVNDDNTTKSQFFGKIAVDQTTGFLAAAWYDARNDPANTNVETFATVSEDGGQTFLPNVQVATHSSNAVVNGDTGGNDFGDYIGLAFQSGKFVPAWADNSTQLKGNPDPRHFDIAIAVVTVPGGPSGGGAPVQLPDDRFDLDDTSNTATQFGTLTGSQVFANLTINHHPSTGLPDNDWFEWTAGKTGTFTAHIDYQSPEGGDLNMRVYTLQNGLLVQLGKSTNTGVTSQQVSVKVSAGEPLLVWIYGFNHADANYTLTDSLV